MEKEKTSMVIWRLFKKMLNSGFQRVKKLSVFQGHLVRSLALDNANVVYWSMTDNGKTLVCFAETTVIFGVSIGERDKCLPKNSSIKRRLSKVLLQNDPDLGWIKLLFPKQGRPRYRPRAGFMNY